MRRGIFSGVFCQKDETVPDTALPYAQRETQVNENSSPFFFKFHFHIIFSQHVFWEAYKKEAPFRKAENRRESQRIPKKKNHGRPDKARATNEWKRRENENTRSAIIEPAYSRERGAIPGIEWLPNCTCRWNSPLFSQHR